MTKIIVIILRISFFAEMIIFFTWCLGYLQYIYFIKLLFFIFNWCIDSAGTALALSCSFKTYTAFIQRERGTTSACTVIWSGHTFSSDKAGTLSSNPLNPENMVSSHVTRTWSCFAITMETLENCPPKWQKEREFNELKEHHEWRSNRGKDHCTVPS